MELKVTKEIELSNDEVKNIIIKYLHRYNGISGIFDVRFEPQEINKIIVRISENHVEL